MGLIKAALGAAGGVFGDQWKEFFYADSLSADVLVTKGHRKTKSGSSNAGDDNIISQGSVIAVNAGQCMLIVEQGKVVDFCAEPGEYQYDKSTEPSLFAGGDLAENINAVFQQIGRRFTFGGDTGKDQRVYYINTKEITGNKYGTPSPVPFRVVDNNIGLDMDISIRCFGEYSYRIVNPVLFYTNVCANVSDTYGRSQLDSQLKSELMTALQPAFAKISALGIRYSALPGHTQDIADALNEVLSQKWDGLRGIRIVSFGVNNVSADEDDLAMIKDLQRSGALRNPTMAAAQLAGAQAAAMQSAAQNAGGAAVGFMGMNMAANAGGMNPQNLYAMGQQQATSAAAASPTGGWTCSCGQRGNQGKFCQNCGQPQPTPAPQGAWTCACGHAGNTGRFCSECGKPRPDAPWTCRCGSQNTGKFCQNCGQPRP